jgi:hypothetical protein
MFGTETYEIWTSTKWYLGPDRLSVAVGGGEEAFSPRWELVKGEKAGRISQAEFAERYERLMKASFADKPDVWRDAVTRESGRVVLTCYCRRGQFCHRRLLAMMLVEAAKSIGIDARYCAEIP